MENFDDIYNKAVNMLKAGHSKAEVLEKFSDAKTELAPLLNVSELLFTMPKNIVPTPLMQRKYALSKAKIFWLSWSHAFKFATATSSFVLVLSTLAVTGYAASQSLPGHSLFALKRAEEHAQLIFTLSPTAKANLQIALAQKRLDEAKQVFDNPSQNNPAQQTAALAELTSQTSDAVTAAASVAKTDPASQNNHPLLSSLQNLTDQQQTLLKQIKPDGQIKQAAQTALLALNNNTKQISEIKQSVAVAGNTAALAKINATSSDVSVLGVITKITEDQIVVEKNVFNVNSKTLIQDEGGNTLKFAALVLGQRVNIIGNQEGSALVAEQILAADSIAATSTAQTLLTTSNSSAAAIAKKTSTTTIDESTAPDSVKTDPNIATGGFIVEDPNPIFH